MVAEGKLSASTLRMIKRWESAHANTVENFALFAAGVGLACTARVPSGILNGLMASYTLARVCYAIAYVGIESDTTSQVRGICWWWGNVSALSMIWLAGKRLQDVRA